MNIFKILFSRKKSEEAKTSSPASTLSPYARFVVEVGRSVSARDLFRDARDYSGYVRQAAVERCVELGWPEFFPLLAERSNDWVLQVRRAARVGLLTMLPSVPAAIIIATLPALLRLQCGGRGDYQGWLQQFESQLIVSVRPEEFVAAVEQGDARVARACVHILMKYDLIPATELITKLLNRRDDIVLASLAITACAQLPAAQQEEQYRAAAHSHFGSVRTVALKSLLQMEIDGRREMAIDSLCDAQSSVRLEAIKYLHTIAFDVCGFYRGELQRPQTAKRTCICLFALAGLRNPDDLEFIKAFVSSGGSAVRQAALAMWFKLSPQDKDLIAAAALSDPAPGVRKFASQLVRRYGAFIPYATVRSYLEEGRDLQLLLNLSNGHQWNWLESIARLSLRTPLVDTTRQLLQQSLREWLVQAGHSFENPGKDQAIFLSSEAVARNLASLVQENAGRSAQLRRELDLLVQATG